MTARPSLLTRCRRINAFDSDTTAAACCGSAARRAVIALTVAVNSALDVPGAEAGSAGPRSTADAVMRASRNVATTTKAVATRIATGNRTRLFITLPIAGVRNAEIRERRQVRHVVAADTVAKR